MSYKKNRNQNQKITLHDWNKPYLEGSNITLHNWKDDLPFTQHHFGTKYQENTHNHQKHQDLLLRYRKRLVECFILDISNGFNDINKLKKESILLKVIKTPSWLYKNGSKACCMSKTAYQQNRLELIREMLKVLDELKMYYECLNLDWIDQCKVVPQDMDEELKSILRHFPENKPSKKIANTFDKPVLNEDKVSVVEEEKEDIWGFESQNMCGPKRKSETHRSFRNSLNTTYNVDLTTLYNILLLVYCEAQKVEKILVKAHNTKLSKDLKKRYKSETLKSNKTLKSVSEYVRPKNTFNSALLNSVLKDSSLLHKKGVIPKASYFRNKKAIQTLLERLKTEMVRKDAVKKREDEIKASKYERSWKQFQNKVTQNTPVNNPSVPKPQNKPKNSVNPWTDEDWDLD